MDYKDEYYNKMPFYMAYPMQNLYMMEMEYEKDMERMKELYPREVQRLQQMIEKRCDQMEYDGSRIYDENPDRMMLEEEVRRILEQFLQENPQYRDMNSGMPPRPRPEMPSHPMPDNMRPEMPPRPMPDNMRPGMPPRPMPIPDDMGNGVSSRPMPDNMRPGMSPRPMPGTGDMGSGTQMSMYAEELSAQQRGGEVPWLRSLIGILFHDEIYRRRCRHRRCRRWW